MTRRHFFQTDPIGLRKSFTVLDITKKLKKNFLRILEKMGGNISRTCKMVGMSRQGYYFWMDKDPDFEKAFKATELIAVEDVESALYKSAIKGNPITQIFILKNKKKEV